VHHVGSFIWEILFVLSELSAGRYAALISVGIIAFIHFLVRWGLDILCCVVLFYDAGDVL